MQTTRPLKQNDDPHDVLVVAPDVVLVAPTDEELSKLAHTMRHSSNLQPNTALPAGPTAPPVDTAFRPAARDIPVPGRRPSIGRRAVRAFTGFILVACIGAAAIAWQSSGNVAKQIIAKWVPNLIVTTLLPPENPGPPQQPASPAIQASAAEAAPAQPAPPAQTAPEGVVAPAAAAPSADSAQLLQSMAGNLATVGQEIEQLKASIEQLKASQQQMSRDIARVSAQNAQPKISALPPRPAAVRARKPMPPLPPPQAAAAPMLPQSAAPYVPRPPEPQPQASAPPEADPELASVPRPPMPVR